MGIQKGAVSLLFELKKKYELNGRVCQLGRQTVEVSPEKLNQIAQQFGYSLTDKISRECTINDILLFSCLGFEIVHSLDRSDYEGATHIHDLNLPVPSELHNQYDAIYDGGTLEHIFNFPESLKNIFQMLKTGGIVMHLSPSNNHFDHGFYNFNPTVFYDYYTANGFEILKSYIIEYSLVQSNVTSDFVIFEYEPGRLSDMYFETLCNRKLAVWFVARKLEKSTGDTIPQQGMYLSIWSKAKEDVPVRADVGIKTRIFSAIRQQPWCNSGARFIYSFSIFRRFIRPPVIARY